MDRFPPFISLHYLFVAVFAEAISLEVEFGSSIARWGLVSSVGIFI